MSLPDTISRAPNPSPRRPILGRELIPLALVCILLVVGALIWAFRTGEYTPRNRSMDFLSGDPERTRAFVGAKACAECHPGEYAHYVGSGHAHTLRLAATTDRAHWLDRKKISDPEYRGVLWSYALQKDQLIVERSHGTNPEVEHQVLDYAFGSDHHNMTFISLLDRDPHHPTSREHRLSYFGMLDAMQVTPGQAQPSPEPGTNDRGHNLGPVDTLHCFDCHTTLTSSRGNSVFDPATLVPNVSCERCHGPGRDHIAAARRGEVDLRMSLGPRQGTTAAAQIRACGHCHRLPEMAPAGAIQPENHSLIRFQPIGILSSVCYQKSNGVLSCTTCHDPHSRASRDRQSYETACLGCHQPANSKSSPTCPVSPRQRCLDCHMPKRQLAQGVSFTDHWIIRNPR